MTGAFAAGASMTYSVNLLTRGPEAGVFLTRTELERFGAEFNFGLDLNFSYYQGNPLTLNRQAVIGRTGVVSMGFKKGIGGNANWAYEADGELRWIGGGVGGGFQLGSSYGRGYTKPIFGY